MSTTTEQTRSGPAAGRRDTSRDGLGNRLQTFALTHFPRLWRAVQAGGPLRRWVNTRLIDSAILRAETRPYPFSTMGPYTSWDSLTDRTYSGRHLPPWGSLDRPLPDL